MKYEICKGIYDGDRLLWSAIAWTDVKTYAEQILAALSIMHDSQFAILCYGRVVKKGESYV